MTTSTMWNPSSALSARWNTVDMVKNECQRITEVYIVEFIYIQKNAWAILISAMSVDLGKQINRESFIYSLPQMRDSVVGNTSGSFPDAEGSIPSLAIA